MDSTRIDSRGGPLGTYTKFAVGDDLAAAKAVRKWERQAVSRRLLPDERVAFCLWKLFGNSKGVGVMYSSSKRRAYYENLLVCGSVWSCPVCSSKISSQRREELSDAVSRWGVMGGSVVMATYTVSHGRFDDLALMIERIGFAFREMIGSRAYRSHKEFMGLRFTVRALEVTWSDGDGWHPHMHVLMFLDPGAPAPDDIEEALYRCWKDACDNWGLKMSREHGVRVDRAHDSVGEYVAKMGHEPAATTWTAADELTRWQLKGGKLAGDGDEHLSPFQMLDWLAETGEQRPAALFKEFALTMKGRHQLQWSPGMRQALGMAPAAADEAIAVEHEPDAWLLGLISPEEWQAVRFFEKRGHVLLVASEGDATALLAYVRGLLDDYRESVADFRPFHL